MSVADYFTRGGGKYKESIVAYELLSLPHAGEERELILFQKKAGNGTGDESARCYVFVLRLTLRADLILNVYLI